MRARHKLSAKQVSAIAEGKGNLRFGSRLSDGGGLYLFKSKSGSLTWVFIYTRDGVRKEMGLGAIADVSLSSARDKADEMRGTLANGECPLTARRAKVEVWSFKNACDAYLVAFGGAWKNDASRNEFVRNVGYCGGRSGIWDVPINALDVAGVLRVVSKVKDRPTVAVCVLSIIRRVVTFASAHGHRDVDKINPADRSLIDAIVSIKVRKSHHAAMPYADVPAFVSRLRAKDSVVARALELIVLTGARKSEVLGMTFDEVDFEARTWSVPASRMKMKREHVVPLSARALEIIERQRELVKSGLVFPSRRGRSLSRFNAFDYIDLNGATVHGFRSSLRDWLGDETDHEREVAEGILAHVVGGVEGAYRRGTGLRKRRAALEGWAEYLAG